MIPHLSEIVNFRKKYFTLIKVYTDEGGINSPTMVCPSVQELIYLLIKLVDYLLVQGTSHGTGLPLITHLKIP